MHDIAAERLAGHKCTQQTEHALAAESRHLYGSAIFENINKRDDNLMREVGVTDKVTGFVNDGAASEINDLQVRLKAGKIVSIKDG